MKLAGNDPELDLRLDAIFAALGDTTRRTLLKRLAKGEASVAELAAPFAMTQPAISKHLKVLEAAGLIVRDRAAQRRMSRLNAKALSEAGQWLPDSGLSKSLRDETEARPEAAKTKKKKDKKHKKH